MAIITQFLLDDKDNIVSYKTTKEVKAVGDGGHVVLPKNLVGRKVEITLIESKGGRNQDGK